MTSSTLGGVLAIGGLAQTLSLAIFFAAGHEGVWQSTASNAGYLLLSVYLHVNHPVARGIFEPSTTLAIAGASSLAFHRNRALSSPRHVLDIANGWLLVVHVGFSGLDLALSVASIRLTKWLNQNSKTTARHILISQAISASSFVGSMVLVFSFYDDVYANQLTLYLAAGVMAAVSICYARTLLTRDGESYLYALVEIVTALLMILAAVFAQCDLLGRACDAVEYELFHSQWHLLMATAVGCAQLRLSDAWRSTLRMTSACVCELPGMDATGLAIFALHATATIIFRILPHASTGAAAACLGVFAALECTYALAYLHTVFARFAGWNPL